MFLMAILKVAALQKEGQLNYINALTTRNTWKETQKKLDPSKPRFLESSINTTITPLYGW
jgi:hypothetical protein